MKIASEVIPHKNPWADHPESRRRCSTSFYLHVRLAIMWPVLNDAYLIAAQLPREK